jgi:hypothetical protein
MRLAPRNIILTILWLISFLGEKDKTLTGAVVDGNVNYKSWLFCVFSRNYCFGNPSHDACKVSELKNKSFTAKTCIRVFFKKVVFTVLGWLRFAIFRFFWYRNKVQLSFLHTTTLLNQSQLCFHVKDSNI